MVNVALSCLALLLVLTTNIRNIAHSAPDAYGYQFQWGAWKAARGKSYSSVEVEKERYSVWLDNMRYIEQHNREADKHGFSVKMNSFGDMSLDEWTSFYRCHRPDNYRSGISSNPHLPHPHHHSANIPDSLDWRDKNLVTSVKNQEEYRCHSCYAFSSIGALESAQAIKTGDLVSFSAQQILDCSRSYSNAGCQGGNYRQSWLYIMDNGGVASATSYPYQSEEGSCRFPNSDIAGTITNFAYIEQGSEAAIQRVVVQYGPAVVAIDHQTRSFMFYSSGVYSSHSCYSNYSNLTHEMLVVGYDTYSSTGSPYWIIKNSYGSDWGVHGYLYLMRNENMCGVAMDAAYPIV